MSSLLKRTRLFSAATPRLIYTPLLAILIEGNGSTKIDSVLDRPKKMEALTDPSHDQLIAALPHASGSDWLPHP
jgi:hypothetical protein